MERSTLIYLSGPMTGHPDFPEFFRLAQERLESCGYHNVINPAALAAVLPDSMTYEQHMGIDLQLLDMCGAICMLDGWQDSRGANRELGFALGAGKIVVAIEELVERSGADTGIGLVVTEEEREAYRSFQRWVKTLEGNGIGRG